MRKIIPQAKNYIVVATVTATAPLVYRTSFTEKRHKNAYGIGQKFVRHEADSPRTIFTTINSIVIVAIQSFNSNQNRRSSYTHIYVYILVFCFCFIEVLRTARALHIRLTDQTVKGRLVVVVVASNVGYINTRSYTHQRLAKFIIMFLLFWLRLLSSSLYIIKNRIRVIRTT